MSVVSPAVGFGWLHRQRGLDRGIEYGETGNGASQGVGDVDAGKHRLHGDGIVAVLAFHAYADLKVSGSAATVLGTLVAIAVLTLVPARIGTRQPVATVLAPETA